MYRDTRCHNFEKMSKRKDDDGFDEVGIGMEISANSFLAAIANGDISDAVRLGYTNPNLSDEMITQPTKIARTSDNTDETNDTFSPSIIISSSSSSMLTGESNNLLITGALTPVDMMVTATGVERPPNELIAMTVNEETRLSQKQKCTCIRNKYECVPCKGRY